MATINNSPASNNNLPSTTLPPPTNTLPPLANTLTSPTGGQSLKITKRTLNDVSWLANLMLDLASRNWNEWSQKLTLLCLCQGFTAYLNGTLACPDEATHFDAHHAWCHNDGALQGFILDRVSNADIHIIDNLTNSNLMFHTLRRHHEKQGVHVQISLLIKAFECQLRYDTPLHDTLAEIRNLHRRIVAMGKLKDDDIFAAILINSMNTQFGHMQQSVVDITTAPGHTSEAIACRILLEDAMIHQWITTGQPGNPNHTQVSSISPS